MCGSSGWRALRQDVTPELAVQTIGSITVLGALQASREVKAALADRINLTDDIKTGLRTRVQPDGPTLRNDVDANMTTPDASLRRAMEKLRAGSLSDANTLVETTLARHGLVMLAFEPASLRMPHLQTAQTLANASSAPSGVPTGTGDLTSEQDVPEASAAKRFTCAAGSRD